MRRLPVRAALCGLLLFSLALLQGHCVAKAQSAARPNIIIIQPWELYDLAADRTQLNDLAARQPEKVKELAAKWEAWAVRARAAARYLARKSAAISPLRAGLKLTGKK